MTTFAPQLEALLGYDRFFDNNLKEFQLKTTLNEEQEKQSQKLFQENYIFQNTENAEQYTQDQVIKKSDKKELEKQIKEKQKEWWKMAEKKDLSQEEKNDLIMLKLRNFIDHKSFQKSTDFKSLPKYYQIGTVIDGDDFNMGKIPRGKRSSTLMDQFLNEDKEVGFSKRKFGEIQKEKQNKLKIRSKQNKRKITKKIQKK